MFKDKPESAQVFKDSGFLSADAKEADYAKVLADLVVDTYTAKADYEKVIQEAKDAGKPVPKNPATPTDKYAIVRAIHQIGKEIEDPANQSEDKQKELNGNLQKLYKEYARALMQEKKAGATLSDTDKAFLTSLEGKKARQALRKEAEGREHPDLDKLEEDVKDPTKDLSGVPSKSVNDAANTYDEIKTINIGGVNRSVGANSIITFTLENFSGNSISVGNSVYSIIDDCIEYQLIYLNKVGGYDVVNLNGRTQIEDEFEGLEYVKTVLNTSSYHEKNKWLNEVKRVFNGNIFWLNNEQAERLQHLYSSIQVWLYDIKNDRMIPVVIEDKSIDYQNNKKLISFNVRVSESKTKVIR
jgi:hypothetical protein